MALVLFDMDNTVVDGDVPTEWIEFLIERELVSEHDTREQYQQYMQDYQSGELNFHRYMLLELSFMRTRPLDELIELRNEFFRERIRPLITDNATLMVNRHHDRGDKVLLITATNRFLAEPVARLINAAHLLATEPAMREGRYTGNFEGIPCFQGGKVQHLKSWCAEHEIGTEGSYAYSDSFNDLPLLQWVDNPIAVDPDDKLRAHAEQKNWKIISKRGAVFDI